MHVHCVSQCCYETNQVWQKRKCTAAAFWYFDLCVCMPLLHCEHLAATTTVMPAWCTLCDKFRSKQSCLLQCSLDALIADKKAAPLKYAWMPFSDNLMWAKHKLKTEAPCVQSCRVTNEACIDLAETQITYEQLYCVTVPKVFDTDSYVALSTGHGHMQADSWNNPTESGRCM